MHQNLENQIDGVGLKIAANWVAVDRYILHYTCFNKSIHFLVSKHNLSTIT